MPRKEMPQPPRDSASRSSGEKVRPPPRIPSLSFNSLAPTACFGQLRTHAEINPATANTLPAVHEFLTAIKLLSHAFAEATGT